MTNRTADQEPGGLSPTPPVLAQVDRPTERLADLTDRPLPSLGRVLEMLEIAERNGDRYGARLWRCMVERISDTTCIAGLTEQGSPSQTAVELLRTTVGLLRTARWAGDQSGVQMLSALIDRILDAAYAAPTELRPGADGADEPAGADGVAEVVAHLMPANRWDREVAAGVDAGDYPGWTGADYESHQVLASIGTPAPVDAVAAARRPRTPPTAGVTDGIEPEGHKAAEDEPRPGTAAPTADSADRAVAA